MEKRLRHVSTTELPQSNHIESQLGQKGEMVMRPKLNKYCKIENSVLRGTMHLALIIRY